MSYNGVGLSTPRGSGTNGYIQRNMSHLRPRDTVPQATSLHGATSNLLARAPDQGILEHERKRRVEVKCLELQVSLEDDGVAEDEVQSRVDELRQRLLRESESVAPGADRAGPIKMHERHELAQAKELANEKMRQALRIGKDHQEGLAFDKEAQAVLKIQRAEERQKRQEEQAKIKAQLEVDREKFQRERDAQRKKHEREMEDERRRHRDELNRVRPTRDRGDGAPSRFRDDPSPRGGRSPRLVYDDRDRRRPARSRSRSRSPNTSPPPPRPRRSYRDMSPEPSTRRRSLSPDPRRRRDSRSPSPPRASAGRRDLYQGHRSRSPPSPPPPPAAARSGASRNSRSVSHSPKSDMSVSRSPSPERRGRDDSRSPR